MNHTYRRGRAPEITSRWDIDALAEGTAKPTHPENREALGSLLSALEARGRVRGSGNEIVGVGDFAMLDGRWHRIAGFVKHRGRDRLELQDVACPDMPRHRVAWSEIERVARLPGSGELADLPPKGRRNGADGPVA